MKETAKKITTLEKEKIALNNKLNTLNALEKDNIVLKEKANNYSDLKKENIALTKNYIAFKDELRK